MTVWDRPGAALKPETAQMLIFAWGGVHSATVLLSDGDPPAAVRRAYAVMRYAAYALVWEEHGLRFRVRASHHAAFWDHFVRTGRVEPELHRWLLEAYAQSGRNGESPVPEDLDAAAVERTIERARVFLCEAHRCLGLRSPFPPEARQSSVTGDLPGREE